METLKTLTYAVTGRIARITLNRPAPGHAIPMELPTEPAAFRRTTHTCSAFELIDYTL